MKKVKGLLKNIIKALIFKRIIRNNKLKFVRYFSEIKKRNPEIIVKQYSRKEEWEKKWSIFGEKPTDLGYIVFSHYMGENINFVPNDIARSFIEPILTPEEYQPFYNDKNSLGMFIDKKILPKTFLRSMNGRLYDGDYNHVSSNGFLSLLKGVDKLVLKPSMDMGGKGVVLFHRNGEEFIDDNGCVLTLEYMKKAYNGNFLLQECLKQSPFMAQFNSTSINTLRMATYRDVKTGEIILLGTVLRMGGEGAFVDNICSGGGFVIVDNNGRLGKTIYNEYGSSSHIHNNIDFEKQTFVVPNFDEIITFVKDVARKMPHMSLFANDIAIDENGKPVLIEVNTTQFSYWLFQFHGKAVFDEHTDDLINYCVYESKKLKPTTTLKYDYKN